ncbi:response regulator [Paenibacillus radicis (ex Xue et al. 2023)]|uniref:Response regulator n=1 Tax=Paenibacillus radicis (ex Xue et al. 2023) TaxID=2972489 RepID=A0ABT1YBD5_9BACL|nr:response regulator [Paenibacillus radicis (ex Xue et al. 2023)]MCR8630503.1 response regulator [Paenibacillus radicis (ex Xue et al. 2023)]
MRIVIADDEVLVRLSLRSMIEDMGSTWTVTGEATNGVELLELLKSDASDIVLIDIRMPLMNGLQAIQQAHTVSPHTSFIVISGYSDFSFAQEALKLGAEDYLLKPVSPDDLESSLVKVSRSVREQRILHNRQFESTMHSLLLGMTTLESEPSGALFSESCFQAVIVYTDSSLSAASRASKQREIGSIIRDLVDEQTHGGLRKAKLVLPQGELAFICSWNSDNYERGAAESSNMINQINNSIQQFKTEQYAITSVVLEPCSSIAAFQSKWISLHELSALRCLYEHGKTLELHFLEEMEHRGSLAGLARKAFELLDHYRKQDHTEYMKAVAMFKMQIGSLNEALASSHKAQLSHFLNVSMDCHLDACRPFHEWYEALIKKGEELLSKHQGTDNATCLVQATIAFIEQNYDQDISISLIAEQLDVTHNYLSTLFHKRMGTTFMKYLTEYRMIRAKEWLAMPSIQVQQAAERVGYYSTRHFTKLFTEFVGCYPSEYKKRFS